MFFGNGNSTKQIFLHQQRGNNNADKYLAVIDMLQTDGEDREYDINSRKLSFINGSVQVGLADRDHSSLFQVSADTDNSTAVIKTKSGSNAQLILDIYPSLAAGNGFQNALTQYRKDGVTKWMTGLNSITGGSNDEFVIANGSSFDINYILNITHTDGFIGFGKQLPTARGHFKSAGTLGTEAVVKLENGDTSGYELWGFMSNGDIYAGQDDWTVFDNQGTPRSLISSKRLGSNNQIKIGFGDYIVPPVSNEYTILGIGRDGISNMVASPTNLDYRDFIFANDNGVSFAVATRSAQTAQLNIISGGDSFNAVNTANHCSLLQNGDYFLTKYRSVSGSTGLAIGSSFTQNRAGDFDSGVFAILFGGDYQLYSSNRTSSGANDSPKFRWRASRWVSSNETQEIKQYLDANHSGTPYFHFDTLNVSDNVLERLLPSTGQKIWTAIETEVPNADMFDGSMSFYVDETLENITFKVKKSDGTTFTKTIS